MHLQLVFGKCEGTYGSVRFYICRCGDEATGVDDVQNLSRNFLRGWWPHGSGRLVVYEAIEPTEEEATNERG